MSFKSSPHLVLVFPLPESLLPSAGLTQEHNSNEHVQTSRSDMAEPEKLGNHHLPNHVLHHRDPTFLLSGRDHIPYFWWPAPGSMLPCHCCSLHSSTPHPHHSHQAHAHLRTLEPVVAHPVIFVLHICTELSITIQDSNCTSAKPSLLPFLLTPPTPTPAQVFYHPALTSSESSLLHHAYNSHSLAHLSPHFLC